MDCYCADANASPSRDIGPCPTTGPAWNRCSSNVPGFRDLSGTQLCCMGDDKCGAAGICYNETRGRLFEEGLDTRSGFYKGACTLESYDDPLCNQGCPNTGNQDIGYNVATGQWQCCESDGTFTNANCSVLVEDQLAFAAYSPENFPGNIGDIFRSHSGSAASQTTTLSATLFGPTIFLGPASGMTPTRTAGSISSTVSSSSTASASASEAVGPSIVPQKSQDKGVIAGIVVGSVLGALVVGLVIFFLVRYLRRRTRDGGQASPGHVSENEEASTGQPAEMSSALPAQEPLHQAPEEAEPKVSDVSVDEKSPTTNVTVASDDITSTGVNSVTGQQVRQTSGLESAYGYYAPQMPRA